MNINSGKLIRTGAFTLSELPLMAGKHPRHRTEGTSHGEFALLTFLSLIALTFSDSPFLTFFCRILAPLIRKMPFSGCETDGPRCSLSFRAREIVWGEGLSLFSARKFSLAGTTNESQTGKQLNGRNTIGRAFIR